LEIISSSIREAVAGPSSDGEDQLANLQLFQFWALAKQGNNRFVTSARYFGSNGSDIAEVLVSATVPHPNHGGVTALLPLLLIHYPLSRPGEIPWGDSSNTKFSDSKLLYAGRELEELISVRAAGLLSDIQTRGGLARLAIGPGSVGMRELTQDFADFTGEAKRLAARKLTMNLRLNLGYFHFRKSRIESDLGQMSQNFTPLELRIGTYFNFLKSIGFLQVRKAADRYAFELFKNSPQLFEPDEMHAMENNRDLFVHALLTRLFRQHLVLNTRAD